MPRDDLESRLIDSLTQHDLFSREALVVVGVSGGPDSVCLLHLLAGVSGRADWPLKLHVAHLNHRLRGDDSDADAAFVDALAKSLHLDRSIESVDVCAAARERGGSIEEAGRRARFDFFERVCLKLGARIVALAHHADDNAETVLHRIIRGTGLRGLAGIRWHRPIRHGSDIHVVRPLLGFRRSEIEEYLTGRNIEFRRDDSNESEAYTRNRIRSTLLPLLRERFNPQVNEALLRLADQAAGVEAYLSETCERMLESLIVEQQEDLLVLHCPSLLRKPRVIRVHILRQAILRMGVGERELNYGHLNAVADLAAGQQGSKALDLPGGLKVVRRYSRLVLTRPGAEVERPPMEFRIALPGTTPLPAYGLQVAAEIVQADQELIDAHIRGRTGQPSSYEEWLDADQVHPPLIARSRRRGDRFFPLGSSGMKKLSDFFIDAKIEPHLRENVLVLCDDLGPVWVVPFRMDERVRLTRMTQRILRLSARREPSIA